MRKMVFKPGKKVKGSSHLLRLDEKDIRFVNGLAEVTNEDCEKIMDLEDEDYDVMKTPKKRSRKKKR